MFAVEIYVKPFNKNKHLVFVTKGILETPEKALKESYLR